VQYCKNEETEAAAILDRVKVTRCINRKYTKEYGKSSGFIYLSFVVLNLLLSKKELTMILNYDTVSL